MTFEYRAFFFILMVLFKSVCDVFLILPITHNVIFPYPKS